MARYVAEECLGDAASEVVFVRCAFLMENWATVMKTLNSEIPSFHSLIDASWDNKMPMVSQRDVAQLCVNELVGSRKQSPYRIHVFEVLGPSSYSIQETLSEFQKLAGQELEIKHITDGDLIFLPGHSLKKKSIKTFHSHSSAQQKHTYRGQTELHSAIQKLYEKDM